MYILFFLRVWCVQRGMEVLQGAVSVVEEEGKASRQELLAVVEAEIKTRCGILRLHDA